MNISDHERGLNKRKLTFSEMPDEQSSDLLDDNASGKKTKTKQTHHKPARKQ